MEDTSKNTKTEAKRKLYSVKKVLHITFLGFIALILGFLHYNYVQTLFENDRNFSHLSEIEREISLRTEMGFYYSYYKTVVEEQPFIAGISALMHDRLVEYPQVVNTFNRFNIAPEVILGAVYRYFEPWLNTSEHRQCHIVYRGPDVETVESCVGLGEPIMFYLEAIWWLAGLLVAVVFLSAYSLSNSLLGGVLAVVQYFANHAECTRVHWAPNERENMAMPLLVIQMAMVAAQARAGRAAPWSLQVSIFILNFLCLLFWQFSQFIFLTQTAIFFLMEQLHIIDLKALCVFLHSHFCGLHIAVLLQQGNDMLKTSIFTSFFLAVSVYCMLFSSFRIKIRNRLDLFLESCLVLFRIVAVTAGAFYFKHVISEIFDVKDDSHIWDLLYSKFTNFKNFHTLLYTCSEVFDYLPLSSVKNMTTTCLIPLALFNIINYVYTWVVNAIKDMKDAEIKKKAVPIDTQDVDSDSGIEKNTKNKRRRNLDVIDKETREKREEVNDDLLCFLSHLKIDPAVFYNAAQLAAFAVMAGLVMRLKLLLGTQMCIVSGLILNFEKFALPRSAMRYMRVVEVLCLAAMLYRLWENMNAEKAHISEFSDFPQEELMEWIVRETDRGAAFAGSMPILATVMLVTRRPIVAHPHYESVEARNRTYSVYKVYGRVSTEELYTELSNLEAMFLIVEMSYCFGISNKGCSLEDIWDVEAPQLRDRPRACAVLLAGADHFYPVFRNPHYAVFRIHDYGVRYMPRSFDT